MMQRDLGLEEAIRAVGGIGALARGLGITQPSVSSWRRIPADRVAAVENLTGVPRAALRPDLYAGGEQAADVDEIDLARAREYAMLATLLQRAPNATTLAHLARLQGTPTPIGLAHITLAEAAGAVSADRLQREFFDLFIGVGRGELVPYASYYLTGFLQDRPLARLRQDLARLGLERAEGKREPEDHAGILCEIMSGFAEGRFEISAEEERRFFGAHIAPWMPRLFADLETAAAAEFYRAVGTVGRLFLEIEAEGFAMEA